MEEKYIINELYESNSGCLIFFDDNKEDKYYEVEIKKTKDGYIDNIPNNIDKNLFYNTLFNYNNKLVKIIPDEYLTIDMAIICASNKELEIPSKYQNIIELKNLRYLKTKKEDNYDVSEIENISNINNYIRYIKAKYDNDIQDDEIKMLDIAIYDKEVELNELLKEIILN